MSKASNGKLWWHFAKRQGLIFLAIFLIITGPIALIAVYAIQDIL